MDFLVALSRKLFKRVSMGLNISHLHPMIFDDQKRGIFRKMMH